MLLALGITSTAIDRGVAHLRGIGNHLVVIAAAVEVAVLHQAKLAGYPLALKRWMTRHPPKWRLKANPSPLMHSNC